MATFSLNTTIKVAGGISVTSGNVTSPTSVSYSVPANSYAVVTVGGGQAFQSCSFSINSASYLFSDSSYSGVYVGPSQTITVSLLAVITSGGPALLSIGGALFENSP